MDTFVDVLPGVPPETMAAPVPMHWTGIGRFWFRVAFIYFVCFLLMDGNGTIFSIFPKVGDWLDTASTWPTNHLAAWVGRHVFHLTGIAATWHETGSGDTTLNWIVDGLFVVYALVGGVVWSAVAWARGSRRGEYQTLYAWLRFGLRLSLGFFMLNYGLDKLYPRQMAPISIAILNEPVGNSSPMTLLWSLIGMNPLYEMVCGAAEVLGGVLFLFRRTALLGALLSAFVMTNVVLYNFFFDVPVKLFAMNLLAAILFVMLPDLKALVRFFWLHQPAAPAGVWVPPATRRGFERATRAIEIVFLIGFLVAMPVMDGVGWWKDRKAERAQSPLLGAWKVDAGQRASGAFVTGEGLPATDLYLDTVKRAFTRSSDGALWRTYLEVDAAKQTIQIVDFPGEPVTYGWQMGDADHLVLTSRAAEEDAKGKAAGKPKQPFTPEVVRLTRVRVPTHYPLLDRGFHLVNQWGLER